MIPLRDHNPSGKFPILTYALIFLNVIIFLYTISLPGENLERFFYSFSLIPFFVTKGERLYSFFTSMFLHASFGHLISNMIFLNIFGDNLEAKLGKIKYLLFYFLCGISASIFQIFTNPSSKIPMVGASGAIAGLMGGYLYLFPKRKIDVLFSFGWFLRVVTLPAWTMLFYWFFYQLIYGLGSLTLPSIRGIAYFAHIGGFLTGFLTIKLWKK